MRIPATINGQQYVLDYGTNPRGQVAGVAIYSADGLTDLSEELDRTPTEYKAWDIAIQHNATACLVAEHVPTPAVPAIPATCSTADMLGELHARQDECMESILWATPQALHNKVCDEIAALLAWTQVVSNIHWRAIGVPNGPMLTSEPSPAAAASTAFSSGAPIEQAATAPAQPPATDLDKPATWIEVTDDDSHFGPSVLQSIYVQNECTNTITSIRQAVYTPDQVSTHLHIGWHGTQTHTDSAGREWTRTFGPCVIDNFGSLADCFTGEPA